MPETTQAPLSTDRAQSDSDHEFHARAVRYVDDVLRDEVTESLREYVVEILEERLIDELDALR